MAACPPRHADFDKTRELDGTKMLHAEISDFTGRDTVNCRYITCNDQASFIDRGKGRKPRVRTICISFDDFQVHQMMPCSRRAGLDCLNDIVTIDFISCEDSLCVIVQDACGFKKGMIIYILNGKE
jgi:hypothetical protein